MNDFLTTSTTSQTSPEPLADSAAAELLRVSSAARADELFEQAWQALAAGATRADHPYHLAVVGTFALPAENSSGDQAFAAGPQMRTVVLRWADRAARSIGCHTDVRCPKVAQVRANPATSWLLYDPSSRLQLRISGISTVHSDDAFAEERWARSALTSRRCYLASGAPSSAVEMPEANLPEPLLHRIPTEAEAAPGRANFSALATVIHTLEVLHLTHDGHERVRFTAPVPLSPSASPVGAPDASPANPVTQAENNVHPRWAHQWLLA